MIHVVAEITLNDASQRSQFIDIFNANVPKVLAEDGCIAYRPVVDVDSGISKQPPLRDNVVTVIEEWESLDALHAHLKAPHMAEYKVLVKDLVTSVGLQVFTTCEVA